MTTSTTTRTMTVGGALVLAASGVLGVGVADAGDGTACAPTTRTLDTPAGSSAFWLSAAGHVVTVERLSGTTIGWQYLHDPDGNKTPILDGNHALRGAVDVNGRGMVVGTEPNYTGSAASYEPWAFLHGDVQLLSTPGHKRPSVRKDYRAAAVNGRSAVVGVRTNRLRVSPTSPDYVSRAVVWPTSSSDPLPLAMPRGYAVTHSINGTPLVDILTDGTITAVLDDANGGRHLALWVTPGADPALRPLPDGWLPMDIAGQWVVGRGAPAPGGMFVMSWTTAFTLSGDKGIGATAVSANGTYLGLQSDNDQSTRTLVGAPGTTPRDVGWGTRANDVAGTLGGQLLITDDTSVSVMSCALSLPEATDITVTPVDLPPTKVAP